MPEIDIPDPTLAEPTAPYQIEWLPRETLIRYARNPRKNADAVAAVAASIQEFGFLVPLVIDASNVIVAGDTRWLAAGQLQYSPVPCIRSASLTPAQVRAFRVLDNKIGEKAKWDYELLQLELQEMDLTALVVTEAFAQHELDTILQASWEPAQIRSEKEQMGEGSSATAREHLVVQFTHAQWAVIHQAIVQCRDALDDAPAPDARCIELICADYLAGVQTDA